jgi:arginase
VGDPRTRYLAEITTANRMLAAKVLGVMTRGHFPLVLGGDHSIAVGTVSGLAVHARRRRKRMGLLWVDAHSDINTPGTSPSGNVHGMPLAALLGLGPAPLSSLGGRFAKVAPDHVALVGIRSVDEGERNHLRSLGVHVYTMADIDRHGIHQVMEQAIADVSEGVDLVHVSFDLDSVDPGIAPGVGTPVKGGLDYREAHSVMESLADAGVVTSLEIVEVNPILDDRNRSAETSDFGKPQSRRQPPVGSRDDLCPERVHHADASDAVKRHRLRVREHIRIADRRSRRKPALRARRTA